MNDPFDWPVAPASETEDDERSARAAFTRPPISGSQVDLATKRLSDQALAEPSAGTWIPLGPTTALDWRDYTTRYSGRVQDIAVSEDGKRIYIASARSGAWGSLDEGVSWIPLGGQSTPSGSTAPDLGTAPAGAIDVYFAEDRVSDGDLTLTPTPSKAEDWAAHDIVVIGTGEGFADNFVDQGEPGSHRPGIGILRAVGPLATAALRHPVTWDREAEHLDRASTFSLARAPHTGAPAELVAATSKGLYRRVGDLTTPGTWDRVLLDPSAVAPIDIVTDVAWIGTRLWVAVGHSTTLRSNGRRRSDHSTAGFWFSDGGAGGPFTHIHVHHRIRGLRLGAYAPPTTSGRSPLLFGLGLHHKKRKGFLWQIDDPLGSPDRREIDLPEYDFSESRFAIAAFERDWGSGLEPTVLIGGTIAKEPQNDGDSKKWRTALFRYRVDQGSRPKLRHVGSGPLEKSNDKVGSGWVGQGVHADIGRIRVIERGTEKHVWVVGDGGVHHSRSEGGPGSFITLNDGLGNLEAGYVASHAVDPELIALGTQDNGVQVSLGGSVWVARYGGDGGGVVFHPNGDDAAIAQYVWGWWKVRGGPVSPEEAGRQPAVPNHKRRAVSKRFVEKVEADWGHFYSNLAAVHDPATGESRVAMGTRRVWVGNAWSEQEVESWISLPSGKDPYAWNVPRRKDSRTLPWAPRPDVVSCDWASPKLLAVLRRGDQKALVELYREHPAGEWTRIPISADTRSRAERRRDEDEDEDEQFLGWYPYLPTGSHVTEIAVDEVVGPSATPTCSLYVTCAGVWPPPPATSTLRFKHRWETVWWYDGDGRWYPTGLSSAPLGTTASVLAVECTKSPGGDREVFVGTSIGVYRGVRRVVMPGLGPLWTWEPYSKGLPQREVQDLDVFAGRDGKRTLRAALPASGAWEVKLDQTDPTRTFLRSSRSVDERHPRRFVPPAWANSPSIYVHHFDAMYEDWILRNTLPATEKQQAQLLQNVLFHLEPFAFVPDPYPHLSKLARSTAFTNFRARHPHLVASTIDANDWNELKSEIVAVGSRPDAASPATPWRSSSPSEADLLQLVRDRTYYAKNKKIVEGADYSWRNALQPGAATAHVLVNHRGEPAVPAADVTVTLVRFDGGAGLSPFPDPLLTVATQQAILGLPAGAGALDSRFDVCALRHGVDRVIDSTHPGVASFDIDLLGRNRRNLFIAVVTVAGTTPANPAGDQRLSDFVMGSPHIACRTVEFV